VDEILDGTLDGAYMELLLKHWVKHLLKHRMKYSQCGVSLPLIRYLGDFISILSCISLKSNCVQGIYKGPIHNG